MGFSTTEHRRLQWELVVWGDAIGDSGKREFQGGEWRWSQCTGRSVWWCNCKTAAVTVWQTGDCRSLSAKEWDGSRCHLRAALSGVFFASRTLTTGCSTIETTRKERFQRGQVIAMTVRDLSTAVPPALTWATNVLRAARENSAWPENKAQCFHS